LDLLLGTKTDNIDDEIAKQDRVTIRYRTMFLVMTIISILTWVLVRYVFVDKIGVYAILDTSTAAFTGVLVGVRAFVACDKLHAKYHYDLPTIQRRVRARSEGPTRVADKAGHYRALRTNMLTKIWRNIAPEF
jgi:hypothetical protein